MLDVALIVVTTLPARKPRRLIDIGSLLVPRFRSLLYLTAPSVANFAIKGPDADGSS
jgi:hypothetical protein